MAEEFGQIDNAWLQRRGRPGLAPEFPVHRRQSMQPATNNAIVLVNDSIDSERATQL